MWRRFHQLCKNMCMRIPKGARDECATQMLSRHAGWIIYGRASVRGVFANTCSCSRWLCRCAIWRTTAEKAAAEVFFPMADQPEMEMHRHGQISVVMPEFPRLGESQRVVSGPIYELKDLEKMASEHNPTLAQAQREIEAARGQKLQAGLYPNPTVGYKGDEIRGGSYGGGEQGFFVQQPIILGGKLAL